MKRTVVISAVATAVLLLFTACWLFDDDEDSPIWLGFNITTATKEATWNYSSDNPIYEVDSDTLSVTINNVPSGKTLYLVKRNTGDYTIPSAYARGGFSSRAVTAEASVTATDFPYDSTHARKHFVGEKLPRISNFPSARSALSAPNYATSVEKTYTEGASKQIYVDTDATMSTYKQKSAHLRAVGTNCYVWVVDDYYTTGTASGNKVDDKIAQKYAVAFDNMYPVITNVFGDESNEIIDYDAREKVAITEKSDTGKKINIVVYDIGADYGTSTSVGVVGYFYAKDYYYTNNVLVKSMQPVLGASNVGKYFYIDSVYANSNFNDTISTLAHEFQHMVDFNQKDMLNSASPSTAYNEMLSMLCEDMMQNFLKLEDYASPKNRISSFNALYSMSGITEYRNDDYATLSYSTSYAFGSWLARQYGGAKLVKAMSQNDSVDTTSIVAAVNAVNSTSYTFNDLFEQFLLALTKSTTYTHNKNATETLSYTTDEETYTYPMKAFDLWWTGSIKYDSDNDGKEDSVYAFSLKDTDFEKNNQEAAYKGYNWCGPFLFSTDYAPKELRPNNGISLHGVKSTTAGTETITFNQTGADTLKMYLIIQ